MAPTTIELRGFVQPEHQALHDRFVSLLQMSGYDVIETPMPANSASSPQVTVTLADLFRHEKLTATARRLTNLYFTVTLVDAWIIPILQATPLYLSEVGLDAYASIRDGSEGRVLWSGEERLVLNEKPTGYPGPSDEEFGAAMLERAEGNLGVRLYDRFCHVVRPPDAAGPKPGPGA